MPYPEEMIAPMRSELTDNGVKELRTADQAKAWLESNKDKTAMFVVNSVCGCAAGAARPGILLSLENEVKPDAVATGFAGNDTESVSYIRSLVPQAPPSSPSVYIFKQGKPVAYVPRHVFEGGHPESVAGHLQREYEKHCTKVG
ncbi:MAG: BrxA/BrxB family bacilliredoxin [Planctomycetes bacterium]|nr:BrxA/BrxB family bacilliredoxin [Planctomycetota bacterium]